MRSLKLGSLGLLLCLPLASAWAGGAALPLEINGEIEVNNHVSLENGKNYLNYRNQNILDLKVKSVFENRATAFGEFRVKHTGFGQAGTLGEAGDRASAEPTQLELREGYVEYRHFIDDNLDLKVGKQRTAWGTADGMNPTDNLNPKDLENPVDFKQRLAVNSLKATYYAGPVTLTGVFIPLFVPAVLPEELVPTGRLTGSLARTPLAGRPVNLTDTVVLPGDDYKNSLTGAKAAWRLFDYDMSLSYVYGRDDLPTLTRVTVMPTAAGPVDVEAEMRYARQNVIGYDFSGSVMDMGVWGEAACYLPEKMETETYIMGQQAGTVTVLDEPYYKYVLGADYTFGDGWYVNVQFLHGFFTEHCHDLRNYVTAQMEKKFFDEVLKVTLKGGADVTDILKGGSRNGYMPNLEVSCKPVDNAEIILGGIVLDGPDETTLGQFRQLDQVYLACKYSF